MVHGVSTNFNYLLLGMEIIKEFVCIKCYIVIVLKLKKVLKKMFKIFQRSIVTSHNIAEGTVDSSGLIVEFSYSFVFERVER